MSHRILLFLLSAAIGAIACSTDSSDRHPVGQTKPPAVQLAYSRRTLSNKADGPAFIEVADMNGDGRKDLVVAAFGHIDFPNLPGGSVTIYFQGSSLDEWTSETVFDADDGIYWPNHLSLVDVDQDGDLDIAFGSGFLVCAVIPSVQQCGGVIWFEQTASQWLRHDVVRPDKELFYHAAEFADLNGDGLLDLVTVGEFRPLPDAGGIDRAEVQWFEGTGDGRRFREEPHRIGEGLGSLPELYDVDGDGDLDIVSAEFFAGLGASFAWMEQVQAPSESNPAGTWQRHVIDDQSGPAIQLSMVPNLLGDGRTLAVGSNHTNTQSSKPDSQESAVFYFEPGDEPRAPWRRTQISQNMVSLPGSPAAPQAAPGIFNWGDADNDGDIDLLVSGDGDERLFLLEQVSPGTFRTLELDRGIKQAGGVHLNDLDGDGYLEAVASGYNDDVIYIYSLDSEGSLPYGEAKIPEPVVKTGDLALDVNYTGTEAGNLVVAVFDNYPPTGPPTKYKLVENPSFPLQVNLDEVPEGNYTVLLYIDLEPLNPAMPGAEDVQTTVDVSVPMSSQTVPVTLAP